MGFGLASPTALVSVVGREAANRQVSFDNFHYECAALDRLPSGAMAGVSPQTRGPLKGRLLDTAREDCGCSDYANARLWEGLLVE